MTRQTIRKFWKETFVELCLALFLNIFFFVFLGPIFVPWAIIDWLNEKENGVNATLPGMFLNWLFPDENDHRDIMTHYGE